MGKNTRIKKISRIAFALLALTAWMTIVAVPVGAAPWRGEALVGTAISDIFAGTTLSCGVVVIGRMGGTAVGSAGGGSYREDGTSIRPRSIPIQIRMFLRS